MKFAFVLIFFTLGWHLISFSQNESSTRLQNYIREQNFKAAQYHMLNTPASSVANIPPPSSKLSVSQLFDPSSLKKIIKQQAPKNARPVILNKRPLKRTKGDDLCIDTSFVRLLNTYASWIFVEKAVGTADGGVLIPALMYDTTLKPQFTWRSTALLIKADDMGNVTWIKQFDNADPVTFSAFFLGNAFELPGKDIICVGGLDTTSGGSHSNTIIYRLDKDGNIIWRNALHNSITNALPGSYSISITGVAEGLNGDLILGGTSNTTNSSGHYETIIRLDKNGTLVWDANYGNDGSYNFGAEGMSVYLQNGQVVEVGLSHGSDNPVTPAAVTFLTLDYNTGNLIRKRFFRPYYDDKNIEFEKTFTYYYNQCTRLLNGHFVVYGKLYGDYSRTTAIIDHYGIMEFDASFNLVDAYTISSGLQTNYDNDLLYFDASGKGLISLLEYQGPYDASLYFGAFEKKQFQQQRKTDYSNVGLPGYNGFLYTKDNGYVFIESYFEGGTKSYVEFRKMHNSDTSSVCLGKDTLSMQFLPLNVIEDPAYYFFDSNKSNTIQEIQYNLSQNDTLRPLSTYPCKQNNFCDTVNIHGIPVICGGQPSVLFNAYKNPDCGATVQWNIDSAGIDSLQVQTDTSVLVYFKNQNWQGTLYASLPAGKCFIPAADSIQVNVVRLQSTINLGPDTVLCAGNNLVLHAGKSFSSYKWQDGSTDSVLTVTKPGKYYVSASDNCGNSFSDTILVAAANFFFSIGNDTSRCNNDSIRLTATEGFIHYKWQPDYNISSDTAMIVSVLPAHDTSYIASAEKWPGCMVSDGVNIRVFNSPPINLGNDTSLCAGQSLMLDAGAGFINYTWSNGSTGQQVKASLPGSYFVKATAANGCTSADTLQIINVTPLPVFDLGSDTTLCSGVVYSYDFTLPNATYLWNDGSSTAQYIISQPGTYSLLVTQQGCTASDTVIIGYKNNPVADLGSDTTLCSGNTYLLDAEFTNATYLWQDGSAASTFLVTQAGTYTVLVNLNSCIAKDTVNINYLDKPQFTLGRDTFICQGQPILLHPQINVAVNYLWQDGSGQPYFTATDTGSYSLLATNICGSFFDQILIVTGSCSLVLPNAFTPDHNGLNDLFRVKYPFTVKEFRLSIFNRFGEKVFETADMNKGWDGRYKSVDQPIGIYIWQVQLKNISNVEQESKGTVMLIR